MYTALVLHESEQQRLLDHFRPLLPPSWKHYGHHMTINMGDSAQGPASALVGQEAEIKVVSVAFDQKVIAVGVESTVPSNNSRKHITLAVNVEAGGKPKHSNDLKDWVPVEEGLTLKGKVVVVD